MFGVWSLTDEVQRFAVHESLKLLANRAWISWRTRVMFSLVELSSAAQYLFSEKGYVLSSEIESVLSIRGHFFPFSSGGSHGLLVFSPLLLVSWLPIPPWVLMVSSSRGLMVCWWLSWSLCLLAASPTIEDYCMLQTSNNNVSYIDCNYAHKLMTAL